METVRHGGSQLCQKAVRPTAQGKVKLEILLLCLGYNLNKLHARIQNGRTGSHLFEVKSA